MSISPVSRFLSRMPGLTFLNGRKESEVIYNNSRFLPPPGPISDETYRIQAAAFNKTLDPFQYIPKFQLRDYEAGRVWREMQVKCYSDCLLPSIMKFASDWGSLMETRLASRPTLKVSDIAQKTSQKMNIKYNLSMLSMGIFGIAIDILGQTWERGSELLEWQAQYYSH